MEELRITAQACVPYVHNPGVHGRFYQLDIKRNGRLGKHALEVAIVDDENDQICSPKGRTLLTHTYFHFRTLYVVGSCQGKVAGVIL